MGSPRVTVRSGPLPPRGPTIWYWPKPALPGRASDYESSKSSHPPGYRHLGPKNQLICRLVLASGITTCCRTKRKFVAGTICGINVVVNTLKIDINKQYKQA